MAFICVEKCKCRDCSHSRYDTERGENSCFLEDDLKAAGEEVYKDYLVKVLAAIKKDNEEQ